MALCFHCSGYIQARLPQSPKAVSYVGEHFLAPSLKIAIIFFFFLQKIELLEMEGRELEKKENVLSNSLGFVQITIENQ